ncbi:hypothetical protein [Glutamicibacter ardleyensis]|uniref:DUF8175 domain-containing protein n=1 Tax=Glutamicibacter ardleyensis TaxID=225894 RepID=A0ABQ2DTV6_9MICC|nr:hypothetical protein [Glutamicibacter ardleyensis]GGJ73166.1 hypothetical protein GCM10007173_35210 [Glutamicibacter ardleyensis]
MTSRRSLIIAAVVIIAIVLVAVASYFISSTTKENTSAATPTTPSEPTRISDNGFPVSSFRANEGGTKTAADGQTRIGYTASCDDAVRAAVNYVPAESYGAGDWEKREATLETVIADNEDGAEYIDALRSLARDGGTSETELLEPSIFKVVSCESGKTASVAVAQRIKTNAFKLDGRTVPAAVEIRVAEQLMVWENDDWKLDFSGENATYRPETQLLYTQGKKEPSAAREILGDLFTDSDGNPLSRDGWMELAQ